ncbi:LOW QUALITY PROTEIN: interleukin-31 receptor subunit alpha [Embiotoca jacksoni]|uniref:LOW QUALITY PROTEIN: interleukin-31 receptor subunit alpha n=1 Tax=Embiotoca jacksoni TaxID=100190 RepID=UPI003704CCD6
MERRPAVVWTCLLVAGLSLVLPSALSVTMSKAFPGPPRLIGCVFMYRGRVTCRWEPGDIPATNYTIQVQRKPGTPSGSPKTFTCTTSDTNCTVGIGGSTLRIDFCISITAHSGSRNISSHPRCQPGRTEVILPAAILKSVTAVRGSPRCLNVVWSRIRSDFPVSDPEIKAMQLNSQIEFTAQGLPYVQVQNWTVTGSTIEVCLFKPDSSYTIRLRHRYRGPASPWSPWSNALQGRTGEDAPSAAPEFWRQVKHTDSKGWRFVSLLWKPVARLLANGRVLVYNVTCRTESAQVLSNHGSCKDLPHTSTSCGLLLPSGRCSCALTASTSAGTSPEARVWLLGASEKEPPSLNPITARPLDDRSLEVWWTAPVDPSASSFVVEWFAVREKNSSILHWEKLNGSCRTLVITEGIRPMECYAVSVRTLHGERGAGKNITLLIYTRQGTPSAGPNVKVLQVFGSTVELGWSPVPVELLHGFNCNYTLSYATENKPAWSIVVPSHVHRYTLENLSPGNYDIFMRANTNAGPGAAGTPANVYIGSEDISKVVYIILPLVLTSLTLLVMACLAQLKMVKQKLFQDIPDPCHSSLSHWAPKSTDESMKQLVVPERPDVKPSEVILLSELQNSDADQDHSYWSVHNLQTYNLQYSPLPVTMSERKSTRRSVTKLKTTSVTDLSPSTYSSVSSQPLRNPPTALLPSSYPLSSDCQDGAVTVNDVKLESGGAGESSESRLSSTEEQKTFNPFLRLHQTPASFSDLSSISHSSVLLSYLAEVGLPKHPFSQSHFNSVQSLQRNNFTVPDALSANFTSSFSPFHHSVLVDFSCSPLECDPYIPSDL